MGARPHVAGVAGGLTLSDTQISFTVPIGSAAAQRPSRESFGVDGRTFPGPRSARSPRGTSPRAGTWPPRRPPDVAVVDTDYATANKLTAGANITIAKKAFTVVGLVRQPQGSGPPDAYIPLGRAQALAFGRTRSCRPGQHDLRGRGQRGRHRRGAEGDLPAAAHGHGHHLGQPGQPGHRLADQRDRLANDLGRWLAMRCWSRLRGGRLLTMAAVSRRVREFGTLKALGWRSGRWSAR